MRNLIYLLGTTLCLTAVGDCIAATAGGTTGQPAANITGPAAEGRRAFLKFNCAGCHGMNAAGGMGPRIAGEGDDVAEAVQNGEDGGMPSYRRIVTATDITNLSAYLRSIGTTAEPKFVDWWVAVPTK